MAQDSFLDWWGEDYGDRRMRRQLEGELQDMAAVATAQQGALQSQLSRLQGTLEQRLDKLSTAFYAFVELSDVRGELAEYEDETTVRHAAMRMLRALRRRAAGGSGAAGLPGLPGLPGLSGDLPACPGYWLRPATESLAAAVGGDDAAAAATLAEARGLDPVRTAVFLAAALALAGQAARAGDLLPAALQETGETVTYAQRVLWAAGAHGALGDAGEEVVGRWVGGFVLSLGKEAALAEAGHWRTTADHALVTDGRSGARRTLPWALERMDALIAPLVAARELSALRAWVTEAVTGEAAAGTQEAQEAQETPAAPQDGLAAVAAALVEEGSHDEIALARRARELREIIDDRKAARRPSWDDTQDSLLALVRADAFGKDLRLRRIALASCAQWTAGLAVALAAEAAAMPPAEVDVMIDSHHVRISASGSASIDAANAEIAAENAAKGLSDQLFHRKQHEEETASLQGHLTREAGEIATVYAARSAEITAAARQAVVDRDAIEAELARTKLV
jgi:hypothetical protein